MYKVLVVDDESLIREGIRAKLQALGALVSWVGEAQDGEEALAVMEAYAPDIVIADVRMPNMNGIEMIRQARLRFPETRFVIVSGYAEFEYAEQALNLGVSGYILKPVSEDAFFNTMNKVLQSLQLLQENPELSERGRELETKNRRLVLERLLNRSLHASWNTLMPEEEAILEAEGLSTERKHTLLLVHLDSRNFEEDSLRSVNLQRMKQLLAVSVENCLRIKKGWVAEDFQDMMSLLVLLEDGDAQTLASWQNSLAAIILTNAARQHDLQVTIAIGGIVQGLSRELYRQARAALDLRLLSSGGRIFRYEDIRLSTVPNLPVQQIKVLENAIRGKEIRNVEALLRTIFGEGGKEASGIVRYLFHEVAGMLYRIFSELGVDMSRYQYVDVMAGEVLNHIDSSEELVRYLYTTIIDALKPQELFNTSCTGLVENIKRYLAVHYVEDISVRNLANHFAVNPNYLSTLFRQKAGIPLVQYLVGIRMEEACRLLRETSLSIVDIAESVGYQDAQYFYKVFKKMEGMTAMEYRAKVRRKE